MKIRRTRSIIWLLLPLLLLRAALPAGLMLEFVDGRISLILCSGMASAAAAEQSAVSSAAAHMGKHHTGDAGASVCPFAAALGALGVLPHITTPLVAQSVAAFDPPRSSTLHSPFGPPRTQQSRAPPLQHS